MYNLIYLKLKKEDRVNTKNNNYDIQVYNKYTTKI